MGSELALRQEQGLVPQMQVSMEDIVDRFMASQDIAQSSKGTYRRQLLQFITWLKETGRIDSMNTMVREDILAYREALRQGKKSSYTVSSYMTAVRRFYEWLEAERIFPNIARGVKGDKKAKGFRKDCLTPGQLRDALDSLERSSLEGLRDYALFNLIARTGLRTIEVARAQVRDLRQESGQSVLWIQGKGRDSKDDFVVLMDEAERPIRNYLQARGKLSDDAPLFCSHSDRNSGHELTTRSISRIIKNILIGIGLDDSRLTAHSLRHTAITLSIKGGASIQEAQAMARHTDPKTTMVYFHNIARVESGAERFIKF